MKRILLAVFNPRPLAAIALATMVAVVSLAQPPESYLDVLICKVKPEKAADFRAVLRKMADANRHHKGDAYLVTETEFGERNTLTFIATRPSYAAVEQGEEAFEGALKEAFGAPAMAQMDKEFESYLASSRAELRRRRWDLSINVPADPSAVIKMIGESRWLRTVAVHVRPGKVDDFEAQVRALKTGAERADGPTTLVSQAVAGQRNSVFYFSTLRPSLAAFDNGPPPLREILGEEGYRAFQRGNADNVLQTETTLSRFLPELSNPPAEIAAASPEFWNPKPPAPARAKPAAKR